MIRSIFAVVVVVALPASALAAPPPASSAEPAAGVVRPGETMLIDDGTCPPGRIKQITGGDIKRGEPRIRTCVRRR